MSNIDKLPVNTEPYSRLVKVSMTASEREEAIYALGLGEAIADVILWVSEGIKRRFTSAPKRGFKQEITA